MMSVVLELPIEGAPVGGLYSAADNPRRLPPFGEWGLATWLHGIGFEWWIREDGDRKSLEHCTLNTSCLRAGDGSLGDFTLEFEVRQMAPLGDTSMDEVFNTKGRAGVMFRYETYRRTYALFLECQERVVLYKRVEHEWTALAEHPMTVDPARYYRFRVECAGDRICCEMDGEPLFDVTDSSYCRGRIAVFANTLARFGSLRVSVDDRQSQEAVNYVESERLAAASAAEGLPSPVLWKSIPTPRSRGRLAMDVSPDGTLKGALVLTDDHRYAERDGVALVSLDTQGSVRWVHAATKEAVQRVWDLDGDGKQEVVLYDGPVLKLLDAETGSVKTEAPTPPCNRMGNRGGREDQTPYIPLYMMFPANVRGLGKGRDLLIFDIYTGVWVINDRLELEWWRSCEHGHDIGLYDIDGDGCEEVLCGYTLFDHNGEEMWTVDGVDYMIQTLDHPDHIAIGEFDGDPGNGLEIALTCGNAGFYLLDQEGKVRVRHDVGHAQSLQVGCYRPDLPGRQFLVGCRWGNPGTRVLFGGNGDRLWTIEPDNSYASDLPVRWARDRDLFLVVSTHQAAGFYDGFGRCILPFPDAHLSVSDRAFCAADFTGNGLEDVVVQARNEIRVYTQDDSHGTCEARCAAGETQYRFST